MRVHRCEHPTKISKSVIVETSPETANGEILSEEIRSEEVAWFVEIQGYELKLAVF